MFDKPTPLYSFMGFEAFDLEDLLISATRYYLGRMTNSAGFHAHTLASAWPHLSQTVQQQVRQDVENAFEKDDIARRIRQRDGNESKLALPLGMDMDRRCWEQLRACWRGPDVVAVTVVGEAKKGVAENEEESPAATPF